MPRFVPSPLGAPAIVAALRARLAATGFDAPDDELREALLQAAARFGELLTEHLNFAPERLRADFEARLGTRVDPATAAEVLLSFQPVVGRTPIARPIVVPSHTQVAALPAPGDGEPVLFETLEDLTLARVQPKATWVVESRPGSAWRAIDARALWGPEGLSPEAAAAVPEDVPTLLLALPDAMPAGPGVRLLVQVEVMSPSRMMPDGLPEWGLMTPGGFVPVPTLEDATQGLTQSGRIVLAPTQAAQRLRIAEVDARWIACRPRRAAASPLPGATVVVEATVATARPAGAVVPAPPWASPVLGRVQFVAQVAAQAVQPAAGIGGAVPLDLGTDFFPLGEHPRFNDALQLMSPAWSHPGTQVVVGVRMTNPAGGGDDPLPAVRVDGKPRLLWELHTREGWRRLDADDGTQGFTQHGDVRFEIPEGIDEHELAGQRGVWVRARLAGGHHGQSKVGEHMVRVHAPCIADLRISTTLQMPPVAPVAVVCRRALGDDVVVAGDEGVWAPFDRGTSGVALYLALETALDPGWAARGLSLLVEAHPATGRPVVDGEARPSAPRPRWSLRTAAGWQECRVVDGSEGFTRTGRLQVLPAADPAPWPGGLREPGGTWSWLRVLWPEEGEACLPRRLALNSVPARQSLRLEHETLGSGTGRAGQVLQALRRPVVGEPVLEVREDPADPSCWVRWTRVDSLDASPAEARHYTLDPNTGQVRFGDGRRGRLVPPGPNNVRLREYHTGGGERGNQPAGTIAQLRSALPNVESVRNLVPAAGGRDARAQPPTPWLRHRGRAICGADYEALAAQASREVARVFCRPARADDREAGTVQLVVLPDAEVPRPQPSLALLADVERYLGERCPTGVRLVIAGPVYAPVRVRAQVVVAGAARAMTLAACQAALERFLHPLRGHDSGRGWRPGERPHRSDVVALLGAVDGVVDLTLHEIQTDEPTDGEEALVCAGPMEILA